MRRAARAVINLDNLQHNFRCARRVAPNSRIMAVVKADAYGHGLVPVAKALSETDAFAVGFLAEAIQLREAGITHSVVCLQGVCRQAELELACHYDIQLVVHCEAQLALLESAKPGQSLGLWLKLDTGMHRLGFDIQQAAVIHQRLQALSCITRPPGLLTHLARADEPSHPATAEQIQCFDRTVSEYEGEQSIANSAAVLAWPETHRDWIRPGLMLYGVSPFSDGRACEDLKPVMQLTAPLIAIRSCRRGATIGYGGSYICPRDMVVGVAAIGYGDGYPRAVPTGASVLINGHRAALIGRVSMDMIHIDLSGIDACLDDIVELWGPALSVNEIACNAATISYELLCVAGALSH